MVSYAPAVCLPGTVKYTEVTGTTAFRGVRENATSCLETLKASESKLKKYRYT